MADDVYREPAVGSSLGERFNFGKVSWGAIWAGTIITLGMESLFLLFGIFIGAAIGGLAIWTMTWYLVTMGISFGVGAWCAARLSDASSREICGLHGLATWGLATLATVMMGALAGYLWLYYYRIAPPSGATIWNGVTEEWGGLIWGGVMLSLITAYFGGMSGYPTAPQGVLPQQETPIMRRAS